MKSLLLACLITLSSPLLGQQSNAIVVHNLYYPKQGKDEEVYEWRLHASEVRAKLGLPAGRVLRKLTGDGLYYVIWECEYSSLAAREADVKALDGSQEFEDVQKHMSTLIEKFERNVWELHETDPVPDEKQIRENRRESNKAIEEHDTLRISKHWSADIVVVTSRNAQYVGRQQNAAAFASEFKNKEGLTYVRTPNKVEVNAGAGMAAETGTWVGRWKNGEEKIVVRGSYYAKWMKVADKWLVRAEVYTLLDCEGDSYCKTL